MVAPQDSHNATNVRALERNKKTFTASYDSICNQFRLAQAIEKYTGDTYIQHSPAVADRFARANSNRP